MNCEIAGIGTFLPKTVVTNERFTKDLPTYSDVLGDFFDGMKERRHATAEESSVYMGAQAAVAALRNANVKPEEIDLVLSYSVLNDYECPRDGNFIVKELGLKNATCWTVDTACSSTLTMLRVADAMISSGQFKNVLLISVVHWIDRGINPEKDFSSLGDAAGAFVLKPSVRKCLLGSREILHTDIISTISMKSPVTTKKQEFFEFGKNEASKEFFIKTVPQVAKDLMIETGVFPDKLDWFIAHQAGQRLIEGWCHSLEIPLEKNLNTFSKHANSSAANIPLVMDEYVNIQKKIKRGDKILFFSTAAGIHLSALLWEF